MPVILSKDLRETIEEIHAEVFNVFVWTSDEDVWQMKEHWTRPVMDTDWFNRPILRGDCDDFMLEVYYRLRQNHNFPKDMLRLCVVATEKRVEHYDHAVLAIEFLDDNGEVDHLICDCNYAAPVPIKKLRKRGYKNFSMSQVGKSITERWERIYD